MLFRSSPGDITTTDFKQLVNKNTELIFFDNYQNPQDDAIRYEAIAKLGANESAAEFLASERGLEWADYIAINNTMVNSLHVISTNNLNSLYNFNFSRTTLIEGRGFTNDEVKRGAAVIVVSDRFAQQNGLSLGDKVNLELFSLTEKMGMVTGWQQEAGPLGAEAVQEPKDYRIVGIYRALKWEKREYSITPNTAFIPEASAPKYERAGLVSPIMYSLVVPNKKADAFKKEIDKMGYGEYFTLYDQGYAAVSNLLRSAMLYALVILVTGSAVWAAVLLLFIRMNIFGKKQEAGVICSLGAGKFFARAYLLICCLIDRKSVM